MSKTIMTAGEVEMLGMALGTLVGRDLPFNVSYSLAKLAKAVENELKILIELRQKLVKDYALHNDKGVPITEINPINKQQEYTYKDEATKKLYLEDLKKLLDMKVEIEHLTIPIELLQGLNISPLHLKVLMFMIEPEGGNGKGDGK